MGTSEAGSASVLQKGYAMRFFAVAILALALGTGCGVGADESYDGQTLVTSEGQALEADGVTTRTTTPQTVVNTGTNPTRDPSLVALPQDPIPVYEGRPVTGPSPVVTPMGVGPAPLR